MCRNGPGGVDLHRILGVSCRAVVAGRTSNVSGTVASVMCAVADCLTAADLKSSLGLPLTLNPKPDALIVWARKPLSPCKDSFLSPESLGHMP